VKVLVKACKRSPKEPKRRRGHGCQAGPIPSQDIADHKPEMNLEVDATGPGAGAIWQETAANGEEGMGRRRAVCVWSVGGNP